MFVSLRVQYATVKCVFTLAWNVDSELALRNLQCHSGRSEPPRRTLAWLSQCVSTAQRDAERRRTEETLSSIGIRCRSSSMYTAERKSTKPYAWWPLFCTGCAVGQAASEETVIAVWRWHICAADRWSGRRCFELSAASRRLQQERHTAVSCSSRFVTRWHCRQWSAPFQ